MKRNIKILSVILLGLIMSVSVFAQQKESLEKQNFEVKKIPQKMTSLDMNKDSLEVNRMSEISKELERRKEMMTKEALTLLDETQDIIRFLHDNKNELAIKKGKELIGNFEVLLVKDPSLALLPVNYNIRKEDLIADIEVVRSIVKQANEAMSNGNYQVARELLKDLRSEMIIEKYLVPTASYPLAIKQVVALIEEGDTENAEKVLWEVLGTVVIERTIIPIPILNAVEMLKKASEIDAVNHERKDEVINLIKNARYQLQLAEELGYGKRDKEYSMLSDQIDALEKSVEQEKDSQGKFDRIKKDLKSFKERLFPLSKEKN